MKGQPAIRILVVAAAMLGLAVNAGAGDPNAAKWTTPPWVDATAAFEATVNLSADHVTIRYVYPDGSKGQVDAKPNEDDIFSFRIPGAIDPQIGMLQLVADLGNNRHSTPHEIPLAYVEELDITGNPPVVLPYPLADESYLVRYIPCCNIFGGVMLASRVPVNPMETGEGLPEKLLGDFVILEPDDLTTSTAGTHMRFTIDPETDAALYTYDWKHGAWREVLSYEINAEENYIEVHCPEGGTFVLGTKPRISSAAQ